MTADIAKFEAKPMKISVLTAALQELTPREKRDADPDLAIEEWLDFSREVGSPYIQLSAALHPTMTDVPPEAMLDPVANTLDLREPFDRSRADRVLAAMKATGVGLSDLGYFDNMLVADPDARLGVGIIVASAHEQPYDTERHADDGETEPDVGDDRAGLD